VASKHITQGRNAAAERVKLDAFGAMVSQPFEPSGEERRDGYTTALLVTVPAGFMQHRRVACATCYVEDRPNHTDVAEAVALEIAASTARASAYNARSVAGRTH